MIYCPYTDCELPEDKTSPDHIIPLSLSGINGFEIPADKDFNSGIGSKLEGALANEFVTTSRRKKYDSRGHSGKPPIPTIKNASYGKEGHPAQISFPRKGGRRVWDVRDRKVVEKEKGVDPLRINLSMNIDLPMRFTAKVALGAGYYVYGDLFCKYVDHCQFREAMCFDPANDRGSVELGHTFRVDSYLLHEPPSNLLWLRKLCSAVQGSVVVLVPGLGFFTVGVGLLGQYLATVAVPANTESFPDDGSHAGGHVIAITDKELKRCSLADAVLDPSLVGAVLDSSLIDAVLDGFDPKETSSA